MHLQELVTVCLRVNLLHSQLVDQSNVRRFEMLGFGQVGDIADRLAPARQGTLVVHVDLALLDGLHRQRDRLLMEKAVHVHPLRSPQKWHLNLTRLGVFWVDALALNLPVGAGIADGLGVFIAILLLMLEILIFLIKILLTFLLLLIVHLLLLAVLCFCGIFFIVGDLFGRMVSRIGFEVFFLLLRFFVLMVVAVTCRIDGHVSTFGCGCRRLLISSFVGC